MSQQSHLRNIFLASGSPYRRELLQRLPLEFSVHSPDVDESPLQGESPAELVARLAKTKAMAVSGLYPSAVVIGSDQVAVFKDEIIGKPVTRANAVDRLRQFSGNSVLFLTAVCVCCSETGFFRSALTTSDAGFRRLSEEEIRRYVELDSPLDCAGGFKSEAAGSALLEYLRSDDPTAIIGLPLISVAALLRQTGFPIP